MADGADGAAAAAAAARTWARLARADLARVARTTGQAHRQRLYGGVTSTVELVTAPDGTRAIHKSPKAGQDPGEIRQIADAEELAALLGTAIGAPVPQVRRDGTSAVWVQYLEGKPTAQRT